MRCLLPVLCVSKLIFIVSQLIYNLCIFRSASLSACCVSRKSCLLLNFKKIEEPEIVSKRKPCLS